MFLGEFKILENKVSACDYEFLLERIKKAIRIKKSLLISPIASYTLTLACFDKKLKIKLAKFNYLVPDSQWVKHSLGFLYGIKLKSRIYGPELMRRVCNLCQSEKYNVYLYGTNSLTLTKLRKELMILYPKLRIVGALPSRFKELLSKESWNLVKEIKNKRTDILFVGLGSPIQEKFSTGLLEKFKELDGNIVIIPTGAAFDFLSKNKPQASPWLQNSGFEWLFRFLVEPKRLWKRYLIYGPIFIILIFLQKINYLFNFTDRVVIKDKIGSR